MGAAKCLPRNQCMFDYIKNLVLAKVSGVNSKSQEGYKMLSPWSLSLPRSVYIWSGDLLEVLLICDFCILDIGGIYNRKSQNVLIFFLMCSLRCLYVIFNAEKKISPEHICTWYRNFVRLRDFFFILLSIFLCGHFALYCIAYFMSQ